MDRVSLDQLLAVQSTLSSIAMGQRKLSDTNIEVSESEMRRRAGLINRDIAVVAESLSSIIDIVKFYKLPESQGL
jgi:hypothetical protein